MDMEDYLVFSKKAVESLDAARFCFEQGFYNSCVNRAYYAMFQAAVAALFKRGVRPKSKKTGHDWVQSEFSRIFVRKSKQFPNLKGFLNRMQDWRDTADYSPEAISKKKAKRLLSRAAIFVGQVTEEIDNGSQQCSGETDR